MILPKLQLFINRQSFLCRFWNGFPIRHLFTAHSDISEIEPLCTCFVCRAAYGGKDMISRIGLVGIFAAVGLCLSNASAQTNALDLITSSAPSQPFHIEAGSSFSASGKDLKRNRATSGSLSAITTDLEEALSVIRGNHINGQKLDAEAMTGNAVTGMLHELDPHSNFYDRREYSDLMGEHRSEYSGTGVTISTFLRNGIANTYVVAVAPDSPAMSAGVRFGDRIADIDGKSMVGADSDTVRIELRGKAGTTVNVTVESADGEMRKLALGRRVIHQPSVPAGIMLTGQIGYIDLTNGFNYSTVAETEAALKNLERSGMTSLIIDLRGNGGGILEESIKVAEMFLPAGTPIVSQRSRFPQDAKTWYSTNRSPQGVPLILLVDSRTASASEVLAGALQDNDRALVIGERTFGKGLVQNVIGLPGGTGMTLTSSRYFTPGGRSIQRDYNNGRYEYFAKAGVALDIDKPQVVIKTPTGRKMFGGDGIAPDIASEADRITPARAQLFDPVFFFVRERQITSVKTVTAALETDLLRYASAAPWNIPFAQLAKEMAFVRSLLLQQIGRSARSAEYQRSKAAELMSDPQIAIAVKTIPAARDLYTAAAKSRTADSFSRSR